MTFGQGSQAVIEDLLAPNWQESRTGRPDIPDVPRDGSGTALTDDDAHRDERGTVLLTSDRRVAGNNQAVQDLVHCYHPEGVGFQVEDKGFQEQGTTETVQIDIALTDRADPDDDTRSSARTRAVGDRSNVSFSEGGPYPGVFGEVKFLLENDRKNFQEWDVVSHDVQNFQIMNSNVAISLRVDLELIAVNTADA